MKEKYYRFANIDFLIKPVFEEFFSFAKDYEIPASNSYHTIEDTLEEINHWKLTHGNEDYPLSYFETLLIHSKIADMVAKENVFIFHGSSVEVDGGAFIFTAPSGTGKSTHINILRRVYGEDSIKYINDDKPFIRKNGNEFIVYGSPWNGKSRLSNNVNAKLKGIFIINRSENNFTRKIDAGEAVMHLIKQIHFPMGENNIKLGTDLLFSMVKDVPTYLLNVNMDDSAAKTSMDVITALNKEGK